VTVIGLIVGSSIALQLRALDDVLSEAVVGQLLASAMVREIAPLTTAIIVAARSGTTMVTEIGNMQANSEVLALRSMGIDIQRFLVWPRTVGAMVAVVVLAVYFGVVASVATSIVGGLGLGPNHGGVGAYAIRLGWPDLAVFFAKAWGLGGIVGLMCCHHGLSVDRSVHDVPVRASRAVVHTLAFCILYSVAISAASLALREAW
jgi:phospholipid/cholesterol/gamma-HCH transport system permease protein